MESCLGLVGHRIHLKLLCAAMRILILESRRRCAVLGLMLNTDAHRVDEIVRGWLGRLSLVGAGCVEDLRRSSMPMHHSRIYLGIATHVIF